MGHALGLLDFEATESKASIQDDCDSWYDRNKDWGESPGHSSIGRIEYLDVVLSNREEAERYIESHDRTYRLFAVKYYAYPDLVKSAKLQKLEEKEAEARMKLSEAKHGSYLKTITAEFVTCKGCGSRIAREKCIERFPHYSNYCPVCNTDFRPKTHLDKIEKLDKAYQEAIGKTKAEARACEEKQRKKAKLMWLVKLECHC